jgi:predicted ATPase/DNA-binding SARP family transcriptional activator
MITFRVLGPLEVETPTFRVTSLGLRLRALLTLLLMQPNRVVPTHRLVDAMWQETPPENPVNALHQVVRRLRGQLGPLGDWLQTRPPGYVLAVDPQSIDSECFEAGCRRAREQASKDPRAALATLDAALALWRGPAYAEFVEGFAQAAAVRLEELRIAAYEERTELLLRMGAVADSVAAARRLTEQVPLRDRPVELLMRALAAEGRAAEALATLRAHREALADELGLDPGPGLRELEGQILRAELPTPSPPAAEPKRPSTLPWRPGAMLGRDAELELLCTCLAEQRLVTLVGPGGVGKTRLVLEAAHEVAANGRVWWADLSNQTPVRLVSYLAETVGVDLPAGGDSTALADALAGLQGLLCLDNAETLLADLAPVVEQVIDAASEVRVLATSRERLAAASEHVHVLAPLPLPAGLDRDNPAVRLFASRAPGLEAGLLPDDDLRLVADICRRLDGLPLAIELGAARVPAFGLRELSARLEENLELLVGGRRTAAERHRTLRAVVDWSYALLSADEARLLPRLTVFPGRFTSGQVEGVCADRELPAPRILAALARLVDQSLIQAGQDGSFSLLETIRAFARERLPANEAHALGERHAADTLGRLRALTPRLDGADEGQAVEEIAALGPDLYAAWENASEQRRDLAVELAAEIYVYAYFRQRLDMLQWGLQVADWPVEHPRLVVALSAGSAAAWTVGDLALSKSLAVRAVDAADAHDAPVPLAQLGNLAIFAGETNQAVAYLRRAVRLAEAAGDPNAGLMPALSTAQAFAHAGRIPEARAQWDAVGARALSSPNPSVVSWAHFVAGVIAADSDPGRAVEQFEAAVQHGTRGGNRLFVAIARSYRVRLLVLHHPPAEAAEQFAAALEEWDELHSAFSQWWMLLMLAVLLGRLGADQEAARLGRAVLAAKSHRPNILEDEELLEQTIEASRRRLGGDPGPADARLTLAEALAYGLQALERPQPHLRKLSTYGQRQQNEPNYFDLK